MFDSRVTLNVLFFILFVVFGNTNFNLFAIFIWAGFLTDKCIIDYSFMC